MDRRNHAETPRHSTPLKLSHVQSRSFCTWEPVHWKPTFQEEPRNRGENPESVHGGAPVQCATPLRPAPEEPGRAHHRARRRCRRGRDGCGAGPLVRRDVRFALERALLTAHFESKMHISTSAGLTRSHRPGRLPSAPPRADPGPRTTTPGEKGSVRRAPSPPRAPTTTHHAKREDRRRHVPHPHPQEAGEDQCARVPPAETRPGPGKPLVLTPPNRATAPIPACSSPTITKSGYDPSPQSGYGQPGQQPHNPDGQY